MHPLHPFNDEPELRDRTPPALFMTTELGYTKKEWLVTYYFALGPQVGRFTFSFPRDSAGAEEALARAKNPNDPMLAEARLELLKAILLETMH